MKKNPRKRKQQEIIERLGVPKAELADYLQCTENWVETMLLPRGMPVAGSNGLFPLMRCLRWYSSFSRKMDWRSEFGCALQWDRMDWLAGLVRKEVGPLLGRDKCRVDTFLIQYVTGEWMFATLPLMDGRTPDDVRAIVQQEVKMALASMARGQQAQSVQ